MPQGFDVVTESSAKVDEIHAAFRDADYWRDRLAEFGGDSVRLDSLITEGGSLSVGTTRDLRNDGLPDLIARAVPGDLKVLRKETWRRTHDGALNGDVAITVVGAPISGSATALISPMQDGSVLRFTGTVTMKVPLIGRPVEKHISAQIAQEIPAVQHFTTRWILANA